MKPRSQIVALRRIAIGAIACLWLVAGAQVPGSSPFAFWRGTLTPFVNFTTATQSINDYQGAYGTWPAALSAWERRVRLSLQHGNIGSTLTDVPTLVVLDSTRVTYADIKANGDDLRFCHSSDSTCASPLAYEIDTWNTSGTSYVWIKIPTVTANSISEYVDMYYKNAAAGPGSSPANVWDSNYLGVWHFNDSVNDSTSNANHGTATAITYAAGKVGNGASFNGSTSFIAMPSGFADFTTGLTIEVWGKPTTSPSYARFIDFGNGAGAQNIILYRNSTSADMLFYVQGSQILGSNYLTNGTMSYFAATNAVGNAAAMYKDGEVGSTGSFALPPNTTRTLNYIGKSNWAGDALFAGIMDEIRLSKVARSADWIKVQNLSASDRYLSYGSVQTQTTGQLSITVAKTINAPPAVTVPYTVSGTAVWATDHNLVDGSFNIPISQSSATLNFMVYRNPNLVVDRGISVSMGTPVNANMGATNLHSVTLSAPGNRAPSAPTQNLTYNGTSTTLTIDVFSFASDPDGDSIKIQTVNTPANGSAVISGGNYITYTPALGFMGSDSFTYTLFDAFGASVTGTININVTAPYEGQIWTGLGGNSNWNTPANWTNNTVPTSTKYAYFNPAFCTGAACNATINVDPNVKGIYTLSGYSGTITQNAGIAVTVGSYGWTQVAGTFTGSNAAIAVAGNFSLTGGTFTSTTATFTHSVGNWTVGAGATFNHNSGSMNFTTSGGTAAPVWSFSSEQYNNVTLNMWSNTTMTGTMTVNGALSMGGSCCGWQLNGGTILAKGDVTGGGFTNSSTTEVLIGGSTDQNLNGLGVANLRIASTGGNVNFIGTINIYRNYTFQTGNLVAGTSTLYFNTGVINNATWTFGGTEVYNNLQYYVGDGAPTTIVGTANIAGTLTGQVGCCGSNLNGGVLNALGSVVGNGAFGMANNGTTVIQMTGSANANLRLASGAMPNATLVIDKPGGTVTLNGTLSYTSGIIKLVNGTFNQAANFINVLGFQIPAGSTAIYNQGTSSTTIGTSGWSQLGGTFNGSTLAMTVNGPFTLTNGTFNSTTSTVTVRGNWTVNGTSTFAPSTGTISLSPNVNGAGINVVHTGFDFYKLTLTDSVAGAHNIDFGGTTISVLNNLTLSSSLGSKYFNNGTLEVTGNVTTSGSFQGGTGTVRVVSAGAQTFTGGATAYIPNFEIPATYAGTLTFSGTHNYSRNFTNDNVSGILNIGTSSAVFKPNVVGLSTSIKSGSLSFYNATFTDNATGAHSFTLTDTMTVTNMLTLGGGSLGTLGLTAGSLINCSGNITYTAWSTVTGKIVMNSGGAQTITGAVSAMPILEIATTGTVTSSSTITNSTGSLIMTDGTFTPGGNFSYGSVSFPVGSTGTLVQSGATTVTVGATGWSQAGGTFTGNSGTLTFNGPFSQSGGSFNGGSGNITHSNTFSLSGGTYTATSGTLSTQYAWTISGTPTFNHNNGTITLSCPTWGTATFTTLPSIDYYNLNLNTMGTITVSGTVNTYGTLGATNGTNGGFNVNGGTINAYGNVTLSGFGMGLSSTSTLNIVGSTDQTLSGDGSSSSFGILNINSAGGNVILSGTFGLVNNYTFNSGNLVAGTSTIYLNGISKTYTVGTEVYNNVVISVTWANNLSGTMNIGGTLTGALINGGYKLNGGTLNALGDVVTTGIGLGNGTTQIQMTGTNSANISGGGWIPGTTFTINKTGGAVVNLASATNINAVAGQVLNVAAGNINMNGFALTVGSNITLNGNTITKGAGTLTVNGVVQGTGALFGGTVNP